VTLKRPRRERWCVRIVTSDDSDGRARIYRPKVRKRLKKESVCLISRGLRQRVKMRKKLERNEGEEPQQSEPRRMPTQPETRCG
jgi:hypothetical protein